MTCSVDYGFVLKGKRTLVLDVEEIQMEKGDMAAITTPGAIPTATVSWAT
jgi:hypothetical protein